MAEGRMLKKVISMSRKLANLKTDSARLLYTWIIPHVDVKGRFSADADIVKGYIVPRIKSITADDIEEHLKELESNNLILLYHDNGDRYLEIVKFSKFQNLRHDREAKSEIPAPPGQTPEPPQDDDIPTPGVLPEDSPLSKDKEREVKLSKSKGDFSFTAVQPDFFKNLFADTFKPQTTFEHNTFNKLGDRCYRAMSQLENPVYHRYIIDELEDMKLMIREKKKTREDFIKMFTSKIRKELDKHGVQ